MAPHPPRGSTAPDTRHDRGVSHKPTMHLVSFSAGELAAPEAGKPLPTEILICPWSKQDTKKGVILCGATTEHVLMRNQMAAKRHPRVALDFEHNTVPESPTFKADAKVAAWGTLDMRPGKGIFLSAVEWTPEGESHVRGGHAKGISPAAARNDDGEVIFIHSAGLCRHQEIDGLTLFSASADLRDLITTANQTTPDTDMDLKAVTKLCNVFLGSAGLELIPDTATAEQIEAAAGKGADAIKAAMGKGKETGTETFSADITALRKELDGIKKDRILSDAIRDGKIVAFTAEQIAAMDVDTFASHVGKLEAGKVPMDKRTPEGIATFSSTTPSSGLDQTLTRMGLTKDDLTKYGPKD